jgi:metal-dependent amidase/aminoacylase/carboxypeptidase family protein
MVSTFPLASTVNLKNVRLAIRALQPQLVEWRRQIHQKPELGFQEKITAEFIAEKLQSWGIAHQTGIAETGIVAIIKGEKSGRIWMLYLFKKRMKFPIVLNRMV